MSLFHQLFDIIASDDRIKAQEKIWKIKMTESDYQFHRNMSLVPQGGYCSSTDNQWKKTEKKKVRGKTVAEKKRDSG